MSVVIGTECRHSGLDNKKRVMSTGELKNSLWLTRAQFGDQG